MKRHYNDYYRLHSYTLAEETPAEITLHEFGSTCHREDKRPDKTVPYSCPTGSVGASVASLREINNLELGLEMETCTRASEVCIGRISLAEHSWILGHLRGKKCIVRIRKKHFVSAFINCVCFIGDCGKGLRGSACTQEYA